MGCPFPLDSTTVGILSVAEFLTGVLKSAFTKKQWGMPWFAVFAISESILCFLIGLSIISEFSNLKHWYSRTLFSMAVTADIVYLFFDIFYVFNLVDGDGRCCINTLVQFNYKKVRKNVLGILLMAGALGYPALIAFLTFRKIGFSFSNMKVIDIFSSKKAPKQFWLSFSGFLLLLAFSIIFIIILLGLWETNNRIFRAVFYFSFPASLWLIGVGALQIAEEFVPGFAFITFTTMPPIVSFFFTFYKTIVVGSIWGQRNQSEENLSVQSEVPIQPQATDDSEISV